VNSSQQIAVERGDGIDVVGIITVMWRYKYLIGCMSILFALIAVYFALTAKEIFRAEVIVTVVHDNGLSGSSDSSGGLGGLASLAGLNLGGGPDAPAQGVLASRHLIEELIRRQDLVPLLTLGTGKRATLWFAVKRFQETIVTVHDDALKGLTTITVDWTDAATAAKWANEFVALANELIRAHDLEDATRNVAYLDKQIAETKEVEVQRALSNLMENETKRLMLANARREYAFRVVDPAVPAEVRHSPRRTLMVISGTAIGFFVGVLIGFGRDAFRRRKLIQ
jgi:uncharacterized protein involved in exopolysaccharide biosynthesis